MNVLVACEESGVVREEFKKLGHNAWSCDILPTRIEGNHFQCDVREVLNKDWDLMIAHPPCTRLANSGVVWLERRNLWNEMIEGAKFFKLLLDSDIPLIAVENPIPHKYALEIIGRKYDQIIQPWMFGHMEKKATCLWLKGLPLLKETNNVKEEMLKLPKNIQQRLHYLPPSKNRAQIRSTTYKGIAEAMAIQWSSL